MGEDNTTGPVIKSDDKPTDLIAQAEDTFNEELPDGYSSPLGKNRKHRFNRNDYRKNDRRQARDASEASKELRERNKGKNTKSQKHSIAEDFDTDILVGDDVDDAEAKSKGILVEKKRKLSKDESKALVDEEMDFDVPGFDGSMKSEDEQPKDDPLKESKKADHAKPVMAIDFDEDIAEIKAKEQGYNRGPFPKELSMPDLDSIPVDSLTTGDNDGSDAGDGKTANPNAKSTSSGNGLGGKLKIHPSLDKTDDPSAQLPSIGDLLNDADTDVDDTENTDEDDGSFAYPDKDVEKDAFKFDDDNHEDNAGDTATSDGKDDSSQEGPLSDEDQDLLLSAFNKAVAKDEDEDKPTLLSENDEVEYDPVTGAVKGWKLIHDSMNNLTGPGEYDNIPFDLDSVLSDAIDRGASDLHMYPDRPLGLRINGDIYWFHRYEQLTADYTEEMSQDDSIISNIIEEKYNVDRNADMAYTVMKGPHRGERFRAHWGESLGERYAVYRHINPTIYTPEQIDLEDDILKWGWLDQGLVLVTGPTGSGKSATLACILRQVQLQRSVKICTLEEPVETLYPIDGLGLVQQREIPEDSETFADGIRAAMREDPDILLVGEIRDRETLDAAFQACNTGHLTFATLHANSTADIVGRIFSWFDASEVGRIRDELAQNLKGALAQRLIKNATGDGRVAVREILRMDEKIKNMIRSDDVDGIKDYLHENWDDIGSQGINLMLEHKTTLKAIMHLLPSGSKERKAFVERVKSLPKEKRKLIIKE